jgi:chemotaxis protein methyltransferase CheR
VSGQAGNGETMLNPASASLTLDEFHRLRDLVYEQTGISLREAKLPLLQSRLSRRIRHFGYRNFDQYYERLKYREPGDGELQEMINAVTTNKTSFFREPHHFKTLEQLVLVPARRRRREGCAPSLRIWSAGCSSGEEPYSIAMTVANSLDRLQAWDVRILATDVNTRVLEKARAGIYGRESIADLPPQIVRKYFLSGTGRYADRVQVKPEIKSMVKFGRINLIEAPWPFRGGFDAIFCRNVIIYFDRKVQQDVLERFARCLKPEGAFFAGHSENLFWLGDLFKLAGGTVYQLGNERSR